MRRAAIRQSEQRPPAGGWSLDYSEKGQTWRVSGTNPLKIVEQIVQIQKINKSFNGLDPVWDYCNDIWRARDPQRAIKEITENYSPKLPRVMQRDHWKIEPSRYGGVMWRWLHMFGTIFDKDEWESAIRRIQKFLDPKQSPLTGCPECSAEFATILETDPPDLVTNEAEAAIWTHRVHNRVNRRIGAHPMSFRDAARIYGWKIEL